MLIEEAPLSTVDTAAIEKRQETIVDKANALVVNSPETLLAGENMAVDIKTAIAVLHDELDPGIAKANETHKHLTGQRKKYEDPLKAALSITIGKTSSHRQKEERERREEEARLRAKAVKEAEDARLAEAESLEQAGRTTEAEAVIAEPVRPPPVAVAPTLAKPKGLSYSTTWYADADVDLPALIAWAAIMRDRCAYLEANLTALNALARSSKGEMVIPGVTFRSKTGAARRS